MVYLRFVQKPHVVQASLWRLGDLEPPIPIADPLWRFCAPDPPDPPVARLPKDAFPSPDCIGVYGRVQSVLSWIEDVARLREILVPYCEEHDDDRARCDSEGMLHDDNDDDDDDDDDGDDQG